MMEAENFTIFIKNSIRFPLFNFEKWVLAPSLTPAAFPTLPMLPDLPWSLLIPRTHLPGLRVPVPSLASATEYWVGSGNSFSAVKGLVPLLSPHTKLIVGDPFPSVRPAPPH